MKLQTYRQHLVGLVENEHLHAIGLEEAALDHVVDTARSADNDLGTILQGLHVVTDAGAANAGVALDVHEVANGDHDLLNLLGQLTGGREDKGLALLQVGVDLLQDRDGEGSGLAGTRLGLGNDIVACIAMINRCRCTVSNSRDLPLITGMMARCWIAEGRSKP